MTRELDDDVLEAVTGGAFAPKSVDRFGVRDKTEPLPLPPPPTPIPTEPRPPKSPWPPPPRPV
jgi:hypothetical protein